MPSPPAPDFVTIARVVKTQGRKGEIGAELTTDFPQRFAALSRVFLWRPPAAPQSFALRHHWFHKGLVILALAGVEDMTAAEAWLGAEVQVPAVERVPAPAGSYFVSDLIGCEVFAGEDEASSLGRLHGIAPVAGAADLLEVRDTEGREVLIPFAVEYLVRVDLAARRIRLRLPPGLLDL